MLSGNIWPIHPKPLENELLSSWMLRTAHSNGVKIQTLSRMLYGPDRIPWIRDIDRNPPDWLIGPLVSHTAITLETIKGLTLEKYRYILYDDMRQFGHLKWILPFYPTYSKKHMSKKTGVVFCPFCLSEDRIPYFRSMWRVAFYTFCPKHSTFMYDECPECFSSVSYHRVDYHKTNELPPLLCKCYKCGFDLRNAKSLAIPVYDNESLELHKLILVALEKLDFNNLIPDMKGFLHVIHQFCKLMIFSKTEKLRYYVLEQLNLRDRRVNNSKLQFESRNIETRHYIFSLACWLLFDLENRLSNAWYSKAIRYNKMTKDMPIVPAWYLDLIAKFYNP